MGIFDRHPYDLNNDGRVDSNEFFIGAQMFAGSRQEAIDLTGDDTFYCGDDDEDDPDLDELDRDTDLDDLDDLDIEDSEFDSDEFDDYDSDNCDSDDFDSDTDDDF